MACQADSYPQKERGFYLMNSEYVTVSEAAKLVGVSKQAIYQRLNTSLKDSFKVEQGKKLVNIKALEECFNLPLNKVEQEFQSRLNKIEQDNEFVNPEIKTDDKLIESLRDEISFLRGQIETLNRLLDQQQQLTLQVQLEAPKEQNEAAAEKKKSFWQRIFY